MRRYDLDSSPTTWPAFSVTLKVWMGHSPNTPAQFGHTFSSNRGPDHTLVVDRRTLQYPAQGRQPGGRYPFEYRIPLDRPFTFQPGSVGLIEVLVEQSTLCWENPAHAYVTWEAAQLPVSGTSSSFGTPCGTYGGMVLAGGPVSVGNPGIAAIDGPLRSVGGSFTRIYGGFSKTSWAGLTLPYSLTGLGAPGCSLSISFDWAWPYLWPPTGGIDAVALDLPLVPSLVGTTIYAQAVRFDAFANSLGIATSNALELVIGPHIEPEGSLTHGPFGPSNADVCQQALGRCPLILLDSY